CTFNTKYCKMNVMVFR
ncbi:hypothetical protein D046_0820B, partial [Vibrio parahaemolyticus V-223/04]